MSALEPPSLSSRSSYARKFQDAAFWQPYIDEVMRRHNLPSGLATLGTGGTFPTFLVGTYVIKFFRQRFDGAECFQIERSTQTRVLPSLRVTVPRHVADGHPFDAGWRWPYIVTTRLAGTAWRHTSHTAGDWQHVVAAELGAALRELHELDCPD